MKYYLFWFLGFIACAIMSWQFSQMGGVVVTTFCAGYCFARLLWRKTDEFYKTQNDYWFKKYQESESRMDEAMSVIYESLADKSAKKFTDIVESLEDKENQNESL